MFAKNHKRSETDIKLQSNLSTTATLGTEESGGFGEVGLSYDKFIKGGQHWLLCKFILTVYIS